MAVDHMAGDKVLKWLMAGTGMLRWWSYLPAWLNKQ
jgi:hypothetical protein